MHGFSIEAAPLEELVSPDNLLQSTYWARVKQRFGSDALGFVLRSNTYSLISSLSGKSIDSLPLLVLLRRMPFLSGMSVGYIPLGPDIELASEVRQPFLQWLAGEIRKKLPPGCISLRFDLPYLVDKPEDRNGFLDSPFERAAVDVQVPDTVEVDLTAGEEEILSRMKSKTRYNIRLSGRKGVSVRKTGAEELDLWYDIATETAERDRITLHAKSYFAALFEEAEERHDTDVRLFIAEASGEPLAAIIVTITGSRCIYHFGASRSEGRNLMPTFALQWEAMKYAKAAGCTIYDLFGIPPTEDPKHPLHGLYRIKTGFGGRVVHRAGCWDYPVRPAAYRLYSVAEGARNFYFKTARKKALGIIRKFNRSG